MAESKPHKPDALMFRDVSETQWDVRRVEAHRIGAFLQAGWKLLISEAQAKSIDLDDTYRADRDRPFNPPKKERL